MSKVELKRDKTTGLGKVLKILPDVEEFPFKSHYFEVAVFLMDATDKRVFEDNPVPLSVALVYENRKTSVPRKNQSPVLEIDPQTPPIIDHSTHSAQFRCRINESSMQHKNRRFRLRVAVDAKALGAEASRYASIQPIFSREMTVIRLRLKILNEIEKLWYKDEGGRDKCIQMAVELLDADLRPVGVPSARIQRCPLEVTLLYAGGSDEPVKKTGILRVMDDCDLTVGLGGRARVSLRIEDVSKNHQNQPFRVRVGPDTTRCPLNFDIAADVSSEVVVRSKRNKRKKDADAMGRRRGGGRSGRARATAGRGAASAGRGGLGGPGRGAAASGLGMGPAASRIPGELTAGFDAEGGPLPLPHLASMSSVQKERLAQWALEAMPAMQQMQTRLAALMAWGRDVVGVGGAEPPTKKRRGPKTKGGSPFKEDALVPAPPQRVTLPPPDAARSGSLPWMGSMTSMGSLGLGRGLSFGFGLGTSEFDAAAAHAAAGAGPSAAAGAQGAPAAAADLGVPAAGAGPHGGSDGLGPSGLSRQHSLMAPGLGRQSSLSAAFPLGAPDPAESSVEFILAKMYHNRARQMIGMPALSGQGRLLGFYQEAQIRGGSVRVNFTPAAGLGLSPAELRAPVQTFEKLRTLKDPAVIVRKAGDRAATLEDAKEKALTHHWSQSFD
jgi:hypothetical protein